jgi:hypothetical protein
MSLATYADLQTAVSSWLHRDGLSSIAPDLILLGEKWIFRKARTQEMESAFTGTISSGVIALPTGFLAIKHMRVDGTPTRTLKVRPASWIYEHYPLRSADAKPQFVGVDAGSFVFGPYADSGYTVSGTVYARPTSIQSSANALFLANPDLYLYSALAEAEPYLKNDKRVVLWAAKRDEILHDINTEDKESQWGPGMAVSVE